MSLIALRKVSKRYADREVLDTVSLAIDERERIGVIGANGAGKSTLLKILLGREDPDDGEVLRRRDLTMAAVDQFPDIDADRTIGEVLLAGLGEERPEWERHIADAARTHLALPEPGRRVADLSLGEHRRLALALGLLEPCDLLVLDEPTNHLDAAGVEWLERTLQAYPGALLMVSHDRYLLDRVVGRLAEIDRGTLRTYEGNYTAYLIARAERYAEEAIVEHRRQKKIADELTWARRSAPARTTKQKARLDRLDTLMAANPKKLSGDASLVIPHPPRIGKTILELEAVGHGYDEPLFANLDLLLKRGDRIGIVGPNGAGKTTLLKLVHG